MENEEVIVLGFVGFALTVIVFASWAFTKGLA
jgi:hypothetical protein